MKKLKRLILFAFLVTVAVSCGGGGEKQSSKSNEPAPVNTSTSVSISIPNNVIDVKVDLKTDLSKIPIGQLSSDRTTVPRRPDLKDPTTVIDNLSNFIEGGSSVVSGGQVSSLSYGIPSRRIENPSQITVQEGGVAFLINSGLSGFVNTKSLENQVKDYVEEKFRFIPTLLQPNPNHLNNLTLTMEKGSILFASVNGDVKLSQVGKNNLFSQTMNKPTIIGTDYKELLLLNGNFTIDKNINLDDADDAYNRIEISASNVTNQQNYELKGTSDNLVGIGQKELHPRTSYVSSGIILKNYGIITLSGENSTGIYKSGYLTGKVENNGTITVGKNSVGMYMLDKDYDAGNDKTEDMLNTGNINIGENSIGIYYEDVPLDNSNYYIRNMRGGIGNTGNIKSNSNNAIGIYMNSNSTDIRDSLNQKVDSEKFLINTGNIELLGDKSIGILAKGSRNYTIANAGTIKIGDSLNKNNPSIGMYTDSKELSLNNLGTITIGKDSIGIHGVKNKGIENNIGGVNAGSEYSLKNHDKGKIELSGKGAIGIYLSDSAIGINDGIITTVNVDGGNIGVVGIKDSQFTNNGTISVNEGSVGVYGDGNNAVLKNESVVTAGKNSVGIYSINGASTGNNKTVKLTGDNAIAMYLTENSKGVNSGDIITEGVVNKAIGVVVGKLSEFTNNGRISVNEGSVGVYGDGNNAVLKNEGIITVRKNSVGMYSINGASVENNKTIKLTGDNAIGIYLSENTEGINNGNIITEGIVNKAIGIVIGKKAEFTNNGKIVINSNEGTGIVIADGGIIKNYGEIQITGENAVRERRAENIIVETEGLKNTLSSAKRIFSSLGVYVDTLGRTKPIEGLSKLGLKNADLLIGAEATEKTNATEVTIGNDVLAPFNRSIQSSNIANWNVKTGSLVWEVDTEIKDNKVEKVTLKKQSYVKFADSETTEEVAKGLDEKYTETGADSKDKQVFNYLNTLNDAKILAKTYHEMDGNQYTNVQQRISQTDNILEDKLSDLQKENADKSGHHVSTFFNKDKHKAKTPEIADSDSSAYGISYLLNNATAKQGIYAGVAVNRFKLKDNGKSKENMTMFKLGAYKAFDLNNLKWTLSGDGFISQNDMKRKFVIGNNIYENTADYNAYGFTLRNEIGKTFQIIENSVIKPYMELKFGYGKFSRIKEKNGTLNMEIEGNDFYSIKPVVGVEFGYSNSITTNTKLKASLGLGYEQELGKIEDNVNEAKFVNTNNKINLKGAKNERRGNFKSNVKIGFETGNFNFTVNGGYDTKDRNSHIGVGLDVSF